MRPIVIIELDVFLHRNAKFLLGFVIIAAKIFFLDSGEKRFSYGIVMWRSWCGEILCRNILPRDLFSVKVKTFRDKHDIIISKFYDELKKYSAVGIYALQRIPERIEFKLWVSQMQ